MPNNKQPRDRMLRGLVQGIAMMYTNATPLLSVEQPSYAGLASANRLGKNEGTDHERQQGDDRARS